LQRIVVPLSVAFASLAIGAWAGGPSPQTSTTKKKTTTAATKSKRPPVTARHYAPQQPSAERYKEIQQALAGRGYFKTEPDGTWGPASVDALKHFQHDQNLVEDGKIGSLSLIALGLGPKREPEPSKTLESEQKIP
jgi:peptidoglycan hydrolase-like protein with peptidoglycan-binding domain